MFLVRSIQNRIRRNSNSEPNVELLDGFYSNNIINNNFNNFNNFIHNRGNREDFHDDDALARILAYRIVEIYGLETVPEYLPWYFDVETVDEKCSICLDEIGCDIKCQQCVNHFHKDCVERGRLSKERCPMCRHEVVEES